MLSRIKGWLAFAGAILIAIGVAFIKGRAAGKQVIADEQQRARDRLQERYDEIDSRPLGPDDAYDRLRGLSGDQDRR